MTDATSERWLPVVGYEGLYEVSDLGRVRSFPRRNTKGGVLKPVLSCGGRYLCVRLYGNGDGSWKHVRVHLIVLEAFVGPCPEGMEGLHGDQGQFCNALSNLRWDTHGENILDQVRDGTHNNASKEYCDNGHEFTEANTYIGKQSRGGGIHRTCKRCRADRMAAKRAAARLAAAS